MSPAISLMSPAVLLINCFLFEFYDFACCRSYLYFILVAAAFEFHGVFANFLLGLGTLIYIFYRFVSYLAIRCRDFIVMIGGKIFFISCASLQCFRVVSSLRPSSNKLRESTFYCRIFCFFVYFVSSTTKGTAREPCLRCVIYSFDCHNYLSFFFFAVFSPSVFAVRSKIAE